MLRKAYGSREGCGQTRILTADKSGFMPIIRQEYGQHPKKWQESTDFVDQKDAGMVRNQP